MWIDCYNKKDRRLSKRRSLSETFTHSNLDPNGFGGIIELELR